IPLRNKQAVSKLHPICTKEEITDLILHMNDVKPKRITNVVERKEEYERILKSADRSKIIMHLNHLYLLRRKLSKEQRKLPPTDADFLETAERILFEEFSFVIGIEKTEIITFTRFELTSTRFTPSFTRFETGQKPQK
ncbi:MAG: hypothetical protein K6C36_08815, partial [Clostridia bacterium]|nr:hypothetical protein [Clostridia bacterium]